MATQLVFFRRTYQEIALYGGEVYFDINGRNVGKLMLTDAFVELPPGRYHIRMYKSQNYGNMVGFAEATIDLNEGESLMIRYNAPLTVNLPGNLMISTYNPVEADQTAAMLNNNIANEQMRRQQQAAQMQKSNAAVIGWIVAISVISVLVIAASYAIIYSSIFSMF